jgi:hypothetical protein
MTSAHTRLTLKQLSTVRLVSWHVVSHLTQLMMQAFKPQQCAWAADLLLPLPSLHLWVLPSITAFRAVTSLKNPSRSMQ